MEIFNGKYKIVLATKNEVDDIFELQQKNLKQYIPEEDRVKKGFVTLDLTKEAILEIIHESEIIAAKLEGKVIGYLITMTRERAGRTELFIPLLKEINGLYFEGKPLQERRFCILAQVCIDQDFRGKGILEQIYKGACMTLKTKFELGIGEIDDSNQRSLYAHVNNIGMQDIGQYCFNGVKWHIVVLSF